MECSVSHLDNFQARLVDLGWAYQRQFGVGDGRDLGALRIRGEVSLDTNALQRVRRHVP